jgi:hypothetical protein
LIQRQHYGDPDGQAERAEISSAAWPIYDVIWPAGIALARETNRFAGAAAPRGCIMSFVRGQR